MTALLGLLIGLCCATLTIGKKSDVLRICTQDKDAGTACKGLEEQKMWYFDHVKLRCTNFMYKGCGGNENKFSSSSDCQDSCQTPYLILKDKEDEQRQGVITHKKEDCTLKADPGPCKALILMWHYNTDRKRCELFGYGGCDGNGNNFDSKSQCEEFCVN